MFIWGFSAIFAVVLILGLGLVLTLWIRYNLIRDGRVADESISEYLRSCTFCGHVYLDYYRKKPCVCPRCKSYHD